MTQQSYTVCIGNGIEEHPPQLFVLSDVSADAAIGRAMDLAASVYDKPKEEVILMSCAKGAYADRKAFDEALKEQSKQENSDV